MRESYARRGGVEYVEMAGSYVRRVPIITEDGGTAYAPITPQGLALPLHLVSMCAYCTNDARHVMRAEVGGRILNSLCDNHAETFQARGSIID